MSGALTKGKKTFDFRGMGGYSPDPMEFFSAFVTGLHLFLCLILVLVVLLQAGKGSDVGAALGGGSSQTVFGSRGPATFFHYVTAGAAGLFVFTSLFLAIDPAGKQAGPSAFEAGAPAVTPEETTDETTEETTEDLSAPETEGTDDALPQEGPAEENNEPADSPKEGTSADTKQ